MNGVDDGAANTREMMMKFQITKLITDGTLKGMEIVEVLSYELKVGKVVKKCSWTGPGYKVIKCVPVND